MTLLPIPSEFPYTEYEKISRQLCISECFLLPL
jgi:hypothetical protein